MEQNRLAERALAGDEAAFVAILDLFEQPLFSYFRRRNVPRSNAEDLVQQVFLAFIKAKDRYDPQAGTLQGFLFGTARRVWARHAHRALRQPADLPADLCSDGANSPERRLMDREQVERVRNAVAQLPDAIREVLNLRMYGQLPLAEISRTLDMPVNTVKSHLFRARRMLAGRLDEHDTSLEENENEL